MERICLNCVSSYFKYLDKREYNYGLYCSVARMKVSTQMEDLSCFSGDLQKNIEDKNGKNPYKTKEQ